ncbi:MAG: hypothetical protein MEEGG_02950 [Eggerthella lenta]
MSEASLATEVPDPIERPTLAKFSAGASFVPSPVTATTSPRCCNSRTRRCLSSGRARDMIFSSCTRSNSSSSLRAAKSVPVIWLRSPSSASFHSPIWRAISRAVAGVSPVTILMPIPAPRQRPTAAGTSSRTGSEMAATAAKCRPPALTASRQSSDAVSAHATASVRMARLWKPSNCSATCVSLPSGAHIVRTISGAPFTQRMRRPETPLSTIVAMYLRSVEKVSRSTIVAPARSGS